MPRDPIEPCFESRIHELPASVVTVRGFSGDALQLGASRQHELTEELGFAREVDVERPGRHAGRAGDVGDRSVVVPNLAEVPLCGVE